MTSDLQDCTPGGEHPSSGRRRWRKGEGGANNFNNNLIAIHKDEMDAQSNVEQRRERSSLPLRLMETLETSGGMSGQKNAEGWREEGELPERWSESHEEDWDGEECLRCCNIDETNEKEHATEVRNNARTTMDVRCRGIDAIAGEVGTGGNGQCG